MEAHAALSTERQLMDEFDVSRMTVRQAIQVLVRRGLVYNVQGSGTYVADPTVVAKSLRLTGFSEDMRQRNLVPASEVLAVEPVEATEELASLLDIELGTELIGVRRLRLADGVPMALESVYLLRDLVPVDELDISSSLYEQLEDAGIKVDRAAQTIKSVNLEAETAKHLDQAVGAAAMLVARVTYSDRGRALEYAETTYRGDRYSFELVVRRDP